MKKLLLLFDNYILKISVIITLIFIALYPKLPSIGFAHTWVYVRLEDFAIAAVTVIWFVQLYRKKVKLGFPVGIPIIVYWIAGGISLGFCLLFIASHLANFFPKIAVLEWIRRIEYMILFFVAFSTVKSIKDIKDYLIALCVTVTGVVIYGFGQHYYLQFWQLFPKFFEKFSFCFPSFQTGNEEFAKGIPLCLPDGARDTSTFGGHYDLAAYLVLVLPIIFTFILSVRKKVFKILLSLLFFSSLVLLLFTASRISFVTYLIGITATVLFLNKKKLLIPVWVISILLLLLFNGSTAKRFLETIRLTSIVTNSQGQVVGIAPATLPSDLQKKIAKNPTEPVVVSDQVPTQNLPAGTAFSVVPQAPPVETKVAVVKTKVDQQLANKLKLAYGGIEISTVSGSFLIQKALVYDISFTTRFQAEWPRDWNAFLGSPIFGTGYSSLTLASDNDYLRSLGETGLIGFLTFLFIFLIFGIFIKENVDSIQDKTAKLFVLGLAGGLIGLASNAALIDVFESSKVAESLWIFLGIGVGVLSFSKKEINYKEKVIAFVTSNFMLGVDLLVVSFFTFMKSINNYFVADDFTWLRWAASATFHDIPKYFLDAQGFFYRPLDKTIMLFLYTFLSFQPQGYHVFSIFIHFLTALGVYFLLIDLFGKKIWAFLGSILFILLPAHGENIFWISSISPNLSAMFIIFGILIYNKSMYSKNWIKFIFSMLFAGLGLLSYEGAVIFPLLILCLDQLKKRTVKQQWVLYIPFVALDGLYLLLRKISNTVAAGGDYSYNIYHIIPNFIGNFLGYISLFIFGEPALSFFENLRTQSKAYSALLSILITVVVIIAIFFFRKKLKGLIKNPEYKIFIFGILFAFIALLPFLGLGNMSERYFYLSSVGMIVSSIVVLRRVITYGLKKSLNATVAVGIICALILLIWWGYSLGKTQNDWQHAGQITHIALGYFKVEQQDMPAGESLYFVNRPIRYGNAWVFPVGLVDGLWFIYRDDNLTVHDAKSIEDAKEIAGKDYKYIFSFNKKGEISQVQ